MNQWWITDGPEYAPAVLVVSVTHEWSIHCRFHYVGWVERLAVSTIGNIYMKLRGTYRPVTASEAEAHLAKRYTGVRAATVEGEE